MTDGTAVGGVRAHVQFFFFTALANGGGKIGEPRRVKPTEMTRNARNDIHPHPFYASHSSTKTFLQAHLSMFGTLHTMGRPPLSPPQHIAQVRAMKTLKLHNVRRTKERLSL